MSQLGSEAKDESRSVSEVARRGHGRIVPSRYMNATLSSRAAATSKPSFVQQGQSSSNSGLAKGGSAVSARSKYSTNAISTAKRSTAPSQSTNVSVSRGQSSRASTDERAAAGSTSTNELDVASQLYSWLYMRHTLADSSHAAATNSMAQLTARSKDLDAEEEALMDDRVRYKAERETQLIDELSHERICRTAPPLISQFVKSQGTCQDAISSVARLTSTRKDWNVRDIRVRMHKLEQLAEESTILRTSLVELASVVASVPGSLLASILEGLINVLDVRLENLRLSRDLLGRVRDNFMMACHLESLDI